MSDNFDLNIVLDTPTQSYGFGRAQNANEYLDFDALVNGGPVEGSVLTGMTSGATGVVISIRYNSAVAGRVWLQRTNAIAYQNNENCNHGVTQVLDADGVGGNYNQTEPTHGLIIMRRISPNGVVTAPRGSLCLTSMGGGGGVPALFINTDGGTTWSAYTNP